MKRGVFIYNPLAGDHSIVGKLNHIIGRFQSADTILIPYRFLNYSNDVMLDLISSDETDFVLASGGDGTINYIASLMLKNRVQKPLGIISSGTCNDFAASLGIRPNVDASLDVILSGKTLMVDVGRINNEAYFLNSCAGGLFADISVSTHHELKKNFGPLAYYLKVINEVANIRPFKMKIITEESTYTEEALLFLILNGTQGAGFSNLIKDADLTDGMMDLLLVKKSNHLDLAALFFKVLNNDYGNDSHVLKVKAKACHIESQPIINLTLDGERGMPLPVNIEFIRQSLEVFAG